MDGSNPWAVLKLLAPKVPTVMGAAAAYTLGLSATSSKWDLRTTVIMTVLRSFMSSPKPSPVSRQQKLGLRDPGIKGPVWISKQTIPVPEDTDILAHLASAIDSMADSDAAKSYTLPALEAVEIEWTGHRPSVSNKNEPRPSLAEADQFAKLMADTTSDVTVLYFHGGALYLMDPASHRVTVSRLAKRTGGRAASVRYRLAPQHPFPAALLDCFVAYLALLSPPPGSVHDAVPASKIVFAGDSAGGTLCLALLQLILQLHRANGGSSSSSSSGTTQRRRPPPPVVRIYGKEVPVPLPAGLAMQSPWADLTRCMPSIVDNALWDYLPPPPPDVTKVYEPDDLWPTDPPRGDLYCETGMLRHGLVSPLGASVEQWQGAPPVFICTGQECLTDEDRVIARRLAKAGAKVEYWEFEAMPHVFSAIFMEMAGANMAFDLWGDAVRRMVEGQVVETRGTWVEAKTLRKEDLEVEKLLPDVDEEDVVKRMADAQARREAGEGGDERLMARL